MTVVVLECGHFQWDSALVRAQIHHLAVVGRMFERHRTGSHHVEHSFFTDPVLASGRAYLGLCHLPLSVIVSDTTRDVKSPGERTAGLPILLANTYLPLTRHE